MQLRNIEKNDTVTTLYYELTWNVGWRQILSFVDTIIQTDFKKESLQSLEIGTTVGTKGIDITEELRRNAFEVKQTPSIQKECAYVIVAGYSHIMQVQIRISIWNQLNRFFVQLMDDTKIDELGEHCYDKYVDSIEILGHIDYVKVKAGI